MSLAEEETNSNTGANPTEEKSQDSSLASSSAPAVAASAVEQQDCADVNATDRDQELPQTFPQRVSFCEGLSRREEWFTLARAQRTAQPFHVNMNPFLN